jgi:endo-1,4-beta-xylanase
MEIRILVLAVAWFGVAGVVLNAGELPPAQAVLLEMAGAGDWKVVGNKPGGATSVSADQKALHLSVPQAGEKAWDVVVHSPALAGGVRKGERVWLSFGLRATNAAETGARVTAYLEPVQGSGSYFQMGGHAQGEEIRVQETWTADADYPAGTLRLSVHGAAQPQELAIGPLTARLYGPDTDPAVLPTTSLTYAGRASDAPWRKAAATRMREHRMRDVTVAVRHADGTPVPDAEITWAQEKHAFQFGCYCQDAAIQEGNDADQYRRHFKDLFNYATTPAYLADWGWNALEGRVVGLTIADWLQREGIPARGHLLVYPGWVATPPAWREIPAAERRKRMEAHFPVAIQSLAERGVAEWDVVNELRDNIAFCDDLGVPTRQSGLEVARDWFVKARALAPTASLYINEYWILANGGITEREQTLYETTIKTLLEKGASVDGIGLQGHFGAALTPPDRLLQILDRFAAFGKQLRVTEFDLDVGDEAAQADYTRDFYTTLYSHPAVVGITKWGFWESNHWKPRGAMLRKDWSPKPNYHALRKLLKETLASHHRAKTDAAGRWAERVHRGTHQLTVKVGSYGRRQAVTVGTEGAQIIVTVP